MSQPVVRTRLALGLGLVIVGLGVLMFVLLAEPHDEPSVELAREVPPAPARELDQAPPRSSSDAKPTSPIPAKPASQRELDRADRDRVREQIQQSFAQRSASPAARPADPASAREDDDELPELDREYIRERIKEDLLPVAIECYESALADDPKLGGKLVMKFVILGEPEVGGVVDEATVDDEQSTLANQFMRDCMRESLMAVSFEAPPEGGRLDVTYPFEFEPGEDE